MATKKEKEIEVHLKTALKEIGKIEPWFDEDFNAWIFSHDLYPVEYAGDTKGEVIKNYPLYLRDFIQHRIEEKLSPLMEKKTKGHGGKREGSGRPKGREEKVRIYLPKDIANLLQEPGMLVHIRGIMKACNHLRKF